MNKTFQININLKMTYFKTGNNYCFGYMQKMFNSNSFHTMLQVMIQMVDHLQYDSIYCLFISNYIINWLLYMQL